MFRTAFVRSIQPKALSQKAMAMQTRGIRYYLNKVILIGNVGNDPQSFEFKNGNTAVSFPLATSRRFKDKEGNLVEQTSWHKIKITNDKAEIANKIVKKGCLVHIEGSIRYDTYTNKEGIEVNQTTIQGENFRLIASPRRPEEESNGENENSENENTGA